MRKRDCGGAVICRNGFKPTNILVNNVFASCQMDEEGKLIEIREKYYFEKKRDKGHYLAGVYYFKTEESMKKAFQQCIDKEMRSITQKQSKRGTRLAISLSICA